MEYSRVLLFDDQTTDACSCIKRLKRQSNESPRLRDFFILVDQLFRSYQVNPAAKNCAHLEEYGSIINLAETYARDKNHDVVASTLLLCVAQLGGLILRVENDPGALWGSPKAYIVGLCTGLLPAALAATITSPGHMLPLALDIISIALQLAIQARRRSHQIEQSTQSWAVLVRQIPADQVQRAIDLFNETHRLPVYKRAYISADFGTSVTISGPPSTLSLLRGTEPFSHLPKAELPIAAAYHAAHLDMPCVVKLMGTLGVPDLPLRKNVKLLSSSSGLPYEAGSLHELLPSIFADILQNRICWRNMMSVLASDLNSTNVALTVIEPAVTANLLYHGLESAGAHLSERDVQSEQLRVYRPDVDEVNAVAVVGMASRLPGADSVDEFWDILETGRDLHKTIPKDRFDVKTHVDVSGSTKNTSKAAYGCFLDQPGLFDTNLFNISPREAKVIDPIQRLLLMTTYEVLETAGYANDDKRRIGTFFGQATDDWRETNASQDIDLYYVPGGMRAFGPGRLNYHFKWEGPSYSIDTACSSSSAAVEMAYKALLGHDCDMAVAGGGNLLSGPQMFAGLSRGDFVSPTGSCKTFDQGADGYCRGEGVGVVVLKRLHDAIAERDNILGVIRTVATNHSAHAISITHPHAPTQKRLYQQVLQRSLLQPADIGYVEMHGTGTRAGDATEIESVCSLFGKSRRADNPLRIGAVKANVGHGEAAAGITSVIKSLLMLKRGTIPPHPGIKTALNPSFPPLAEMNIDIPKAPRPFTAPPHGDGRRRILVNNFNATGGNTSLIIEDYNMRHKEDIPDPRLHHVVAVSARSLKSLEGNKQRILQYLRENPDSRLADISYTTTARRMHHVYRSAYSVETPYELRDAIAKDLSSSNCPERIMGKPLTVFVFTGQGSQYAGMGRNLFRTCQVFRDSILECNAICTRLGYESFLDLIVNDDVKRLDITPAQSQLALVSLELALVEMWKAWGIIPDIVMGHSLGEYAALCTAGVLSVYDVLYIVGKRGQMMQRKCAPYTHSMLAVESDVDLVRTALEHEGFSGCTISCINSSSSTVVSARLEDLISLRAHFDSVRTSILKVPYAFHSPQVDVILEELESVSTHVRFNKPMIPVISTLTGLAVEDEGVFGPCYLARQAREPVNFLQAMQTCQERFGSDNTTWLEIGPSRVCLDLVRLTLPLVGERTVSTLKPNKDCWETISKAAAQLYTTGADVKWSNYHMEHQKSLHFIEMPTYSFDAKNYWIPYEGDWALMNKDHPATAKALPPFSTTCLQHIAHEAHEDSMSSVTFTSDLSEPSLFETIQGHLVLGLGLCPSSVLTDMAITAASYLFERMEGTKPVPSMDVAKMEIFHPLVVLPGQSNVFLKLHAKRLKGSGCVEVSCNSERASISQQHAHCIVEYGSHATWKKEWAHSQHLVKARSETLVDAAKSGLAHNVLQGMVYKLFANLVLYSERYRSIHEVYMDNNLNEAAATLSFRETESADKFTISPYWVDGIIHLGGFILNGHVNTSQEFTYICTGWDNLRIPTDLSPGHMYSSYAHMQPTGHGLFVGDVFLLRDGETVAGCKSLKFQQIRRTSLQALLSTAAEKSGNNPLATSETTLLPSDESFSEAETNHSSRPVLSRGRNSASIAESPIMDIRGIIAEEADIQGSELPADVSFDELGIDSILKMHICAKIQERTGVILPPSVFDTYPTVTTLLDHIEKDWQSSSATTIDSENTTLSCSPASSVTSANSPEDTDVFDVLLSTICAETGIDSSAMGPSSVFSDLGVDSLIGIAVVSRVRDQTGRMIPSSFFRDHPTISAARNALDTSRPTPSTTDRSSPCKPVICKPDRFSRSVFLQGNPDCKAPALFLVADGSGSPASYHHIPPLPSGIAVYGLESPFCHQPMEWDCSFEDVAAMYKDAIRKVQPHGPYIIAGWSLGGMQAFEISRHLLLEGEQVRGLLLIDAPSPELLMHVPEPTMEVLETIGLFSALRKAGMRGKALVRTQQHLMQSIHSLNNYVPKPMDSEHRPDFVSIIWGTSGVFEELGGKVIEATHLAARNQGTIDPHEMHELQRWMTAPREDFGPNGWERLVGTDVDCYQTEGDHFSMMNPPLVDGTGQLIAKVLERFLVSDGANST